MPVLRRLCQFNGTSDLWCNKWVKWGRKLFSDAKKRQAFVYWFQLSGTYFCKCRLIILNIEAQLSIPVMIIDILGSFSKKLSNFTEHSLLAREINLQYSDLQIIPKVNSSPKFVSNKQKISSFATGFFRRGVTKEWRFSKLPTSPSDPRENLLSIDSIILLWNYTSPISINKVRIGPNAHARRMLQPTSSLLKYF